MVPTEVVPQVPSKMWAQITSMTWISLSEANPFSRCLATLRREVLGGRELQGGARSSTGVVAAGHIED